MGDREKSRGRPDPPTSPKFDWPDVDRGGHGISSTTSVLPEYIASGGAAWTHAEVYPEASKIYDAALKMLCQKHMDYSATNISQAPGGAINGLRVRMHDKWARLNHLVETGAEPQNESLLDTLRDIQNYAVIWQMVLEGTWPS